MKKRKMFDVTSQMKKKNIPFLLFIIPVLVFAKPGGYGTGTDEKRSFMKK